MRKTRRKRNRASGRKFPLVLIILMAACVIHNIVNEAHFLAIKDKRDLPEAKDFDDAIVHVQRKGFERKDVQRSAKDIETAAYHEAGHAIVAYHMDHQSVGNISIRPTTAGAGGYTMIESSDENNFKPLQSVKNRIAILYGGRASEAKRYGSINNASMGLRGLRSL